MIIIWYICFAWYISYTGIINFQIELWINELTYNFIIESKSSAVLPSSLLTFWHNFASRIEIFGLFSLKVSSLIRKVYSGRNIHHTTLVVDMPRPLLHRQGHQTFDPSWRRGFGNMALRMGQDRGGARAPAEIDTSLLPSHNGLIYAFKVGRWSKIVWGSRHAQFFDCVSIIFRNSKIRSAILNLKINFFLKTLKFQIESNLIIKNLIYKNKYLHTAEIKKDLFFILLSNIHSFFKFI